MNPLFIQNNLRLFWPWNLAMVVHGGLEKQTRAQYWFFFKFCEMNEILMFIHCKLLSLLPACVEDQPPSLCPRERNLVFPLSESHWVSHLGWEGKAVFRAGIRDLGRQGGVTCKPLEGQVRRECALSASFLWYPQLSGQCLGQHLEYLLPWLGSSVS